MTPPPHHQICKAMYSYIFWDIFTKLWGIIDWTMARAERYSDFQISMTLRRCDVITLFYSNISNFFVCWDISTKLLGIIDWTKVNLAPL